MQVFVKGLSFYLAISAMFTFLPVSGSGFAEEPLVVKIRPFREKEIDYTKEYKYQLLELVLSNTEATDGPFQIDVAGEEDIAQSRVIELIDRGALTLIVTMTSREREEQLLPIRIPIFKGLYGYRIFIINRQDLDKFAGIKTEEELKALWAGQGHDWPDTKILQANGYNVATSPDYQGLFAMLQKGRFDYFPRAMSEPWREVEEEMARDVVVEPSLLIQYHAPAYFFVSTQNTKLAERLERGLEMAIQDGSFDRLFNSHWYIQDTLKSANIQERTMFRLKNPLLTPETPLDRPELWYQP